MTNNNQNDNQEKMIDDMIKMLDDMVTNGTGHINLAVDGTVDESDFENNLNKEVQKKIKTWKSNDAAEGCFSCRIPNLDDGRGEDE